MNRIAAMYTLFLCLAFRGEATAKLSIYDPLGVLSVEQRNSIETEGQTLVTNRKVNGQDLLIQIDFLTSEEFDKGGGRGWDKDFRNLFSLGTYTSWSVQYYARPAVLILFLDQGDGQYVLDGLNFSDKLMDEGIHDLVRRYIRDEIMKKETDHMEMISSGLYAIGEALNPVYRQRLEQKGNEMLDTDDRYQRAHCVYGNCNYYEFTPEEESVVGPTQPKDMITLHGLPESRSDNLTSVIDQIIGWDHTHESEIVSNWPWIYDNSTKKYILNSNIPDGYFAVKKDNPWSVLNASSESKDVAENLPVMAWLQIHGWRATYCNFFAQDLSYYVLGHLPWETGRRANDIHNYIGSSADFYEISISNSEDIEAYSELGFLIYFTRNSSPNPGHIATNWILNGKIIQAGSKTGIMTLSEGFGSTKKVVGHIYLGHLKKRI